MEPLRHHKQPSANSNSPLSSIPNLPSTPSPTMPNSVAPSSSPSSSPGSASSAIPQEKKKVLEWLKKKGGNASGSNMSLDSSDIQLNREGFSKIIAEPSIFAELKLFDSKYDRHTQLLEHFVQLENMLVEAVPKFAVKSSKMPSFARRADKSLFPNFVYRFMMGGGTIDGPMLGIKGELPVVDVPMFMVSNFLVFHEAFLSANAPPVAGVSEQMRRQIADQLVFGSGNKIPSNIFDPAVDAAVLVLYREVFPRFLNGSKAPSTNAIEVSQHSLHQFQQQYNPGQHQNDSPYMAPVNSRGDGPAYAAANAASPRMGHNEANPNHGEMSMADMAAALPDVKRRMKQQGQDSPNAVSPAGTAVVHQSPVVTQTVPYPEKPMANHQFVYSAEQFDPELQYSRESYARVLDDVVHYREFQAFCEVDFCMENFMFIESFTKLEQQLAESITKYGSAHKAKVLFQYAERYQGALRSGLVRRFLGFEDPTEYANASQLISQSSMTSTSNTASTAHSSPTTSDDSPFGYVPVWLVSHFLVFYDTYIAPGSPHEVNIAGTLRRRITDTLVSGGAYKISTTVFDEAADEVMRSLYLNTYARFVQVKKGTSMSGGSPALGAKSRIRQA
ncbi:hypothetical protein BJ742DRAFT_182750 [Cladochytrium replicatum]|nr:hypothetical protein BJ742DRAFT_182750 [Cladochytrium replicatum]